MLGTENIKKLSLGDRLILETAETQLRKDQPDRFDLHAISRVSGIEHSVILSRFPYPELLTLGIMVMLWEEKANILHETSGWCKGRPNGYELNASGWVADPDLLDHFADHPIVMLYLRGEPPLRMWFRK